MTAASPRRRWSAHPRTAAVIGVAVLAVSLLAGCGNYVVVTAGDVASNYVYALGEGNNAKACGYFTPGARASLAASAHPRASCPEILRRCVPSRYRQASADQSQLLYANTDVTTHGDRATVTLSATPAAAAVRQVTVIHQHGHWRLTSPGRVVTRCLTAERHRGHRRRHG
ncbi:MAG TPA: hypothetical protein VFN55_09690 [Solirubrobacteraceae bacterium]|nr:hypothetical protein [Solirubrobacteraceae bacterium]